MNPDTSKPVRTKFSKLTPVCIIVFIMSIIILFLTIYTPCFFYGRMNAELKDSELFDDMTGGRSFCFLGDSITAGSATGGISWHHHLDPYIKGDISDFAYAGWTSRTLVEKMDQIPSADIYVIAIGINDVLFPEDGIDTSEYTDNLRILTEHLKDISPDSKFYFITPWIFFDFPEELEVRRTGFTAALCSWCEAEGYICIDPNPIIYSVVEKKGKKRYMQNNFHPNAERGVGLFSYAVLEAEHQRRVSS